MNVVLLYVVFNEFTDLIIFEKIKNDDEIEFLNSIQDWVFTTVYQ